MDSYNNLPDGEVEEVTLDDLLGLLGSLFVKNWFLMRRRADERPTCRCEECRCQDASFPQR